MLGLPPRSIRSDTLFPYPPPFRTVHLAAALSERRVMRGRCEHDGPARRLRPELRQGLLLQHDRDLAHPDGSAAGRGQTITGGSEKAGSGFADLDRRPFGGGAFGGDRQCLVMALDTKQAEAAVHCVGFGKRAEIGSGTCWERVWEAEKISEGAGKGKRKKI